MSITLVFLALLPNAGPLPRSQPPAVAPIPLPARPIGPATMGGRVTAVAVVESKPAIQYIGTAGGGVWKTGDNGLTWNVVFPGRPHPSIGAVCVAPSNPDVVWVGAGEANARNSVSWGNGVFRSTDAGKTWQHLGLAETHHIGKIIVHPKDPNTAWVAALGHLWGPNQERGVFKTSDGGKTWQHSLRIDLDTGCIDLAIDPGDPKLLYAAACCMRRDGFAGGNPATQFGKKAGLYRSSNAGKTWERLSKGLPDRPLGRCGLDVSRSDPKQLYAVIPTDRTNIRLVAGQPAKAGNVTETGGIFRSRDKGDTWEKVNDLCPRPFYFGQVRIDPRDPERVYVLGIPLYATQDGGKTFRQDAGRGVHVDHHDMWIDPADPAHLVLGNDGGLYYSINRTNSWTHVANMPIGQFYGIGLDNRTPYRIYGGLQDNGSWAGPSRGPDGRGPVNADWMRVLTMDGFHCQIDPGDSDILYAEGQYGRFFRIDLRTKRSKPIRPTSTNPTTPAFRFNWSTPILASSHQDRALYYGGNFVFRSLDRGDTWQIISPDLTRGAPGASAHTGHTITTLAESPLQKGLLWAGSDDGRVHVTRDSGKVWVDVSARIPGVPPDRWITRIECSPWDAGTAWLSLTRHRQDDRAPYLFVTTDHGANWKKITGNLPGEGYVHVVRADPRNRDLLYVGTEFGLFASLDSGTFWRPLGADLPPAAVHDLVVHPRERELVIATHGRSLYVMDVAPLQELTSKARGEIVLFGVRPALVRKPRPGDPVPARTFAAPTPAPEAGIHYWLKVPIEGVKLRILDATGKPVVDLPAPTQEGLHRVAWDLKRGGKVVGAGEYAVELRVGEKVLTTKVKVTAEE